MSDPATLVKARLALVRGDLNALLDQIDSSLLDWAPTDGMRTIGGQLIEIAEVELQTVGMLREGVWISYEEAAERFGDADSFDKLRKLLNDLRQDTLSYIDSLSPEEMREEVSVNRPW